MVGSYSDLQLSPLRSLDDFLLGTARLDWPPYNDLQRLLNRILNNLLYYQTNYFVLCLSFFLLVGLNRPNEILLGTTVLLLTLGCIAYTASTNPKVVSVKRTYPVISLITVVSILYLLVRSLHSLMFCLFALALPVLPKLRLQSRLVIFFISVIFLHASCRLRNLKNKLSNAAEELKIKKTPIGVLFDLCGIKCETFWKE
ncbi:PRA1 family protein 3 [Trichuris trichiura]|uniref:PRA1 family protein n=1 Tax=Trichuris trichiura TaxID=36087 RepID=A0A077Z067_TRITR|nr:PRA1 family protein 3 [Trichuris trichiura]